MFKIWSLIPTPYKIGGLFALCAVVLLGLGIYRSRLIATGYENCQSDYDDVMDIWSENARNEIIKAQSKYKVIYRDIDSTPDNGIICPISRGVIDRLPEPTNRGE